MSLLAKYSTLEAQMKALQEQMKALEDNKDMKVELEFKKKLEDLMNKYNKSAGDVVELLDPYKNKVHAGKTTRRPRRLKIYKHPETGEVIETRGGNHKQLREWKDEFGSDVVETWVISGPGAENAEPVPPETATTE